MAKSNLNYDDIIVGAGLSGLILGQFLSQQGRRVAILEEAETTGGNFRSTEHSWGSRIHGLKVIPVTDETEELLTWLESFLGEPIEMKTESAPPITFHNGRFKPFVGFGEQPPAFFSELENYTASQFIETQPALSEWAKILESRFEGDLLTKSRVTRIQTESRRVSSVVINGAQIIEGERFFFGGSPKSIPQLLSDAEALTKSQRQKLAKWQSWTAVSLELAWPEPLNHEQGIHVLSAAKSWERPCVGRFFAASPPEASSPESEQESTSWTFSQWFTLVRSDLAEDDEETGMALKEIKKQVKRAYPGIFERNPLERIAVDPVSHGRFEGKWGPELTLHPMENLWLLGNKYHAPYNVIGGLAHLRAITGHLPAKEADTNDKSAQTPS